MCVEAHFVQYPQDAVMKQVVIKKALLFEQMDCLFLPF